MALDVTDATFQTEVVQRSAELPVIVDLWAPWCGPCRTLGPIIERVIASTDGRVVLTKVNVDENPQISQAFQVQSIPAVYAIRDGKIADKFVGALPEHQVKAWIDRLAPPASESDLLTAKGDEVSLRRAIELEPTHAGATIALAELLATRGAPGDADAALALLARLPETVEVRRVAALARVGAVSTVDAATTAELDSLLPLVKADEVARQRFLDLLEVMGDDPLVGDYRKKLASRLF